MNKSTFKTLRRWHTHRILDMKTLERNKPYLLPFVSHRIDSMTGRIQPKEEKWNSNVFTTDFRNNEANSRDRLDEVVFTYLLFLSNSFANQKFNKTIVRPWVWMDDFSWNKLLKWVTFSVITVIYNIDWKPEYFCLLDELTIDLMLGKPQALRQFFTKIGISINVPSFQAEKNYTEFDFHRVQEFGPYYWRMLHWMAEAFPLRNNSNNNNNNNDYVALAKNLWREFTVESLHRTLRCGICSFHYKTIISSKYRSKLLDASDEELPMVWYEIHKDVNINKPPYSESDFSADRKFMQWGLK